MEQPPPDRPRRSKARERQLRRHSRTTIGSSSIARRAKGQLAPAGGIKIPNLDLRYVRPVAMGAAALVFMLAVIWLVGLFKNEPQELAPNALWLGQDWTYYDHDDDEMRELIERLEQFGFGTVYAYVSELNVDGTWTGIPDQQNRFSEVRQQVTNFADQFKRLAPNIQLFGTIVFRTDLDTDGYRLDSDRVRTAVANFGAEIAGDMGFDGVFLQVDPFVSDGDEYFLDLLDEVRQAIGEESGLAVTIPPDWTPTDAGIPMPSTIEPGTMWDSHYKQRVALHQVDQFVLRVFDSSLTADSGHSADDYIQWVAYQVRTYAEVMSTVQPDLHLLIAISTMDDIPQTHDVEVENVPAAIIGVQQGIEEAGASATVVQGIALFADWSTDDVEWAQFEDTWIGWKR